MFAVVLRHWFLLRHSWPRLLELVYWPAVQMLMWGFLQTWLLGKTGVAATAAGAFLGGVLLWDVLFRGQLGFSITFLEEMWARNIGHLMMTPLRPWEFVAALMVMSVVRVAIGLVPVTLLAIWFFGFNLWGLGLALGAFFLNLYLTSWAIGLCVCGVVLRYGLGAESLRGRSVSCCCRCAASTIRSNRCPRGCRRFPCRWPRPMYSRECAPCSWSRRFAAI